MPAVLASFVQILVGGISAVATGVAGGIKDMAVALFLDTSGSTPVLSEVGGLIAIFAGVSLAIALTTKVWIWVSSIGSAR